MKRVLYLLAFATMLGCGDGKGGGESRMAVVLVDMQNDFTQFGKGSLAVGNADGKGKPERTGQAYIDKVKVALKYFREKGLPIIATQDWHPKQHISFASTHQGKKPYEDVIYIDNTTHKIVAANAKDAREQRLWPDHCVEGTSGAQLVEGIKALVDECVQKGTEKNLESYSGFYKGFYGPKDSRNIKSSLDEILRKRNINKLIVFGLATDYCVGATAIDGVDFKYEVVFVSDLSEGVAGDTAQGKCKEMEEKGIKTMTFEALKSQIK